MASAYLKKIRTLAQKLEKRDTTLYFPDFGSKTDAASLNRVFGPPVGITDKTWPKYPKLKELLTKGRHADGWDGKDLRMEHVFTIDLAGLKGIAAPKKARVMMLFISDAGMNEAYMAGTPETAVLFLSEKDVARGLYDGAIPERSKKRQTRRFSLQPIQVPGRLFSSGAHGDNGEEDPERDALKALRKAIFNAPAYIGGEPMWIQGEDMSFDDDDFGDGDDDDDGDDSDGDDDAPPPPAAKRIGLPGGDQFILQFSEEFADVNLGDSGSMYVFGDDAYWQCY